MPTFDPIFAKDPGNPNNIASNATITIFTPGDTSKIPIPLTGVNGAPLPNPITVDRNGMGPAFQHATLYRVAWEGGGLSNYFTAYEQMHVEAVAARDAAETSRLLAADAQAAATNAASVAGEEAAIAAEAELAARVAAGEFKGEKGAKGDPGVNAVPAADAVATYATTPGNPVNTALNATIASEVTPLSGAVDTTKKRVRSALRRAVPSRPSRVALPATFGWQDAPINIYGDAYGYTTDFDVAAFKNTGAGRFYVDTVNGTAGGDGLTEGTAVNSISGAMAKAASGDTITILDKGNIYRSGSFQGVKVQKSLNIVAKYPNEVRIVQADKHTYALTAGETRVYQTARSNVYTVIDIAHNREGLEYVKATSLAECAATPGSWFQSADNVNLHVNTSAGTAPDAATILPLLSADLLWANSDLQEVKLYLEGIDLYGGISGNVFIDSTNNPIDFYAKNCGFLWSNGQSGRADSINFDGGRFCFTQDCFVVHSNKDGLNYAAYNNAGVLRTAPKFIEVNNTSGLHGLKQAVAGSEKTNNATTAHTGSKGIRIGGTYFSTMGSVVADVQPGTQTVNYSCTAFDPLTKAGDWSDTAFSAAQDGAEMWLFGCVAFGASKDIFTESTSVLHADSTEFDTQGGNGLDVVNPL